MKKVMISDSKYNGSTVGAKFLRLLVTEWGTVGMSS
jgi:hypothetical protein